MGNAGSPTGVDAQPYSRENPVASQCVGGSQDSLWGQPFAMQQKMLNSSCRRRFSAVWTTGAALPLGVATRYQRHGAGGQRAFLPSRTDVIDGGRGGDSARWLNHACEASCEASEEADSAMTSGLHCLRASLSNRRKP
jgi:hypothetical protein